MKRLLTVTVAILLLPYCKGEDEDGIVEKELSSFEIVAPSSAVMGSEFEIEIRALDAKGSIFTDFSGEEAGTVNLSTSGSGNIEPSEINVNGVGVFEEGVTTVSVTYDQVETIKIIAVLASDPSISGESDEISIEHPASGFHVALTINHASAVEVSSEDTLDLVFTAVFSNRSEVTIENIYIRKATLALQSDGTEIVTFNVSPTVQWDGKLGPEEEISITYSKTTLDSQIPTAYPCDQDVFIRAPVFYGDGDSVGASSTPYLFQCVSE